MSDPVRTSLLVQLVGFGGLGLVDLVFALVVIGSAVGALRRRAGVLGVVGAMVGAALVGWLVVVGIAAWAPPEVAQAARSSQLLQLIPPPYGAIAELSRIVRQLASH